MRAILLLGLLLVAGCVNDFVGNSPEERKHREGLPHQADTNALAAPNALEVKP